MTGRIDRASRLIHAPPATVYRAIVDPEARSYWLTPERMTARLDCFDPQVGGTYRITLDHDPSGAANDLSRATAVEGEFLEIIPERQIVQTAVYRSDDPAHVGCVTMRWLMAPWNEATLISITAEDVPPGIGADGHRRGLATALAHLAAFVERRR